MENFIVGGLLAFAISFYAIPVIILVANQKKLYDLPGERKVHTTPIPSLGGLGIFIGFMMGLLLTLDINTVQGELQYYLASFSVVFFFGIKDDILNLVPMKKLVGQLIVSAILIFKAHLVITNMNGFLGITTIHPTISYLVTVMTIVVVMNAFNLIDGVDGLAGTLSVITSSVFAVFFFIKGDMFHALMGFILSASIVAFLIYNYSPARIFMGDTGSMLIGVINSILVIRFVATFNTSTIIPPLSAPAMGFGILLIPLLDTLRVFTIRIFQGRSPFSPDRNHLHHLLLDRGFNHKNITVIISSAALVFIVATYYTLQFGATYVIMSQIGLFFLSVYLLNKSNLTKKKAIVVKGEGFEQRVTLRTKTASRFVTYIGNTIAVTEEEKQN